MSAARARDDGRGAGGAAAGARRGVPRLHGRPRRSRAGPALGGCVAARRDRSRPAALALASRALAEWGDRVELVHADYRDVARVLDARGIDGDRRRGGGSRRVVDAARRRGARVQLPAGRAAGHADGSEPGPDGGRPAGDVEERDLADVIYHFGEERRSRAVARAIVTARRDGPDRDDRAAGGHRPAGRRSQRPDRPGDADLPGDPHLGEPRTGRARRVPASGLSARLRIGARFAVVTFHSLEDRPVKHAFRALAAEGRIVPPAGEEVGGPGTTNCARTRAPAAPGFGPLNAWGEGDGTAHHAAGRDGVQRAEGHPEPPGPQRGPRPPAGDVVVGRLRRRCFVGALLLSSPGSTRSGRISATRSTTLQKERAASEAENRHLQLELETLRTPRRIESAGHCRTCSWWHRRRPRRWCWTSCARRPRRPARSSRGGRHRQAESTTMNEADPRAWQQTVRGRVLLAAALLAVWAAAIEARLVWLQVYQHEAMLAEAQRPEGPRADGQRRGAATSSIGTGACWPSASTRCRSAGCRKTSTTRSPSSTRVCEGARRLHGAGTRGVRAAPLAEEHAASRTSAARSSLEEAGRG